jgi:hypothetical protein
MVAALANFALIMAVNTAFVASSELMERVAHRWFAGSPPAAAPVSPRPYLNTIFFSIIF